MLELDTYAWPFLSEASAASILHIFILFWFFFLHLPQCSRK